MSDDEIKTAENRLNRSTKNFEQAVDQLKEAVGDSMDKATHLVEKMKLPKQKAEAIYSEKKQVVENFIKTKQEQGTRTLKEVQNSTDDFITLIQKNPLIVWVAVFFSGYIFGYSLAEKRKTKLKTIRDDQVA
jgi:hypothetical protein